MDGGHVCVVLFDGVCLLCSGFVHFVLDNTPPQVKVCPLQSELGKEILAKHNLRCRLDTIVLVDRDGAHTRSTAVLRIFQMCGFPYSLAAKICLVIPSPLRDVGYRVIAVSRYRLFGKDDESCRMMTPLIRERFLTDV